MGQSYRELNRIDLKNVLIKHLDTISAVTNTPFAVKTSDLRLPGIDEVNRAVSRW